MSDTSSRLLKLLSLLQAPCEWPGSELAERLQVSPRTIRRDVGRLLAYDNDRQDWRIFRIDRIRDLQPTGARTPPRDLPADAVAYVTGKLYSLAPTYRAIVTLHAPAADVARRLGGAASDLTATGERTCRLETHADTLEWLAFRLILSGCEFEVHQPPELAGYLRALGARLTRAAGH